MTVNIIFSRGKFGCFVRFFLFWKRRKFVRSHEYQESWKIYDEIDFDAQEIEFSFLKFVEGFSFCLSDNVKTENRKKIFVEKNIREGNYVEEGSHNLKLLLKTFSLQHFM